MNGIIIRNQEIGHNQYKIDRFMEEFNKVGVPVDVFVNNGTLAAIENNDVVFSAFFSPDGSHIVSASYDKTIRIWDAITGQQIGKPLEGHVERVFFASYSPDGKRIASASCDKTIRIWDATTGLQIGKPLEGHTENVRTAFFSPDGKYVISSSDDRTIRIWDVDKEIPSSLVLRGHTGGLYSATFSSDGRHIVSSSYDKTVKLWDYPPLDTLIYQTRERFKERPLTPEERRKYYLE